MFAIQTFEITLLIVALLIPNCVDSKPKPEDVGNRSASHSFDPERRQNTTVNTEAKQVMADVASTYSRLIRYRTKGTSTERSVARGIATDGEAITFTIDYERGKGGTIRWEEGGKEKYLSTNGKTARIEVDGKEVVGPSNSWEVLLRASFSEKERSLFPITLFVFREEQQLGDKFFAGLVDPQVIGEEEVDGNLCYVLKGTYTGVEASNTFWIDKESSLIRRIDKDLTVRIISDGKEYVSTSNTRESYTNILIEH